MNLKKNILLGAGFVLLILGIFIYNTTDLASQAIRYQLGVLGGCIYEFQAANGHRPVSPAHLARTSISARYRYRQEELHSGRVVVIWPHDLKPGPRDNGHRILAYVTGGLISWFGRNWVLWGDLRTEYLSAEKLKAALHGTQD
jgi:hypothetical protein